MREEVRRLTARVAEMERRALGWRTLLRGALVLFTPSPPPPPAGPPPAPPGVRGRVLKVLQRLRPVARRFPRAAAYVRYWIYGR